MEIEPQEYIVKDVDTLAWYIDLELGLEYEITRDDAQQESGSVTVFGLDWEEHRKIRNMLDTESLWAA